MKLCLLLIVFCPWLKLKLLPKLNTRHTWFLVSLIKLKPITLLHPWLILLLHQHIAQRFPQHQHIAVNLSALLARPTLWQSSKRGSWIRKSSRDCFKVMWRKLQILKPLVECNNCRGTNLFRHQVEVKCS